jgi:hypothetical protein
MMSSASKADCSPVTRSQIRLLSRAVRVPPRVPSCHSPRGGSGDGGALLVAPVQDARLEIDGKLFAGREHTARVAGYT